MSESPRALAAKIADHQAYVDADAVFVAEQYLALLAWCVENNLLTADEAAEEPAA